MRIRLLVNVPVAPIEGMALGRVLEVMRSQSPTRSNSVRWYVIGDTGGAVGILDHEAEVVPDDTPLGIADAPPTEEAADAAV